MKIYLAGYGHDLRNDPSFLGRPVTTRFLISYIYLVRDFVEWRRHKFPARFKWIMNERRNGGVR